MATSIDAVAAGHAIGRIADGMLFERFGLDVLSKVIGSDFVPVGGMHDRGIDGLEHTFAPRSVELRAPRYE